jgi:hypothetical protein
MEAGERCFLLGLSLCWVMEVWAEACSQRTLEILAYWSHLGAQVQIPVPLGAEPDPGF